MLTCRTWWTRTDMLNCAWRPRTTLYITMQIYGFFTVYCALIMTTMGNTLQTSWCYKIVHSAHSAYIVHKCTTCCSPQKMYILPQCIHWTLCRNVLHVMYWKKYIQLHGNRQVCVDCKTFNSLGNVCQSPRERLFTCSLM